MGSIGSWCVIGPCVTSGARRKRKNVEGVWGGGRVKLKLFFFLLEFFPIGCLNLFTVISSGTKSGHQVI